MIKKISNLLLLSTIVVLTGSWKNNETTIDVKDSKFIESNLQYFKVNIQSGGYIIVKAKESQMKGNFAKISQKEVNEMQTDWATFIISDFVPGTITHCFQTGHFSASFDPDTGITSVSYSGSLIAQGVETLGFSVTTLGAAALYNTLQDIASCIPSGDVYWE